MGFEVSPGSLAVALGLLGTGLAIMFPENKWIGLILIGCAVAALFFDVRLNGAHLQAAAPSKRLALIGIVLFGVAFIGCVGWYFWATKTVSKEPPAVTANDVPKGPQSVQDLFNSDFPNLMKLTQDITFDYTKNGTGPQKIVVKFQIYQDFDAQTQFLGFYIPPSPDTAAVAAHLADTGEKFMTELASGVLVKSHSPGDTDSTASTQLKFSGRVYIYYDDDLSIEQLGAISAQYRAKGMSVQFRGQSYATTKWLQKSSSAH